MPLVSRNYSEDYYYWAVPVVKAVNFVLALVAISAISSLILQYGFYLSKGSTSILQRFNLFIVQFYLAQFLLKLLFAKKKLLFLRSRWFEALLAFLIFSEVTVLARLIGTAAIRNYLFGLDVSQITESYIVIAQVLLLLSIIAQAVKYNTRISGLKFNPSQTLAMSFILAVFIGAGLLMLPKATPEGVTISFLDALFTSTSAICVTGLIVVDTATYFTITGQIIIMLLIQIGGLGIMTLSSFLALFFGQGIAIRDRVMLYQMLNVDKLGMITTVLRNSVIIMFFIESIGALLLFFLWSDQG